MANGKQVSKPKSDEVEGPAAPVKTAVVQMTPSQLSASLSKAKTDEEINRALENALNYINRLSPKMTDKEYKENKELLTQLVAVRNAQAARELQPKVADECIQRLSEVLGAPSAAKVTKSEIPLQFQQFGFFQLADIAGAGSVAFGNLPSEQAYYIPEEFQGQALDALNKLANAYFSGGNTAKAGKEYLDFVEKLARQRWGNDATAKENMICNIISAGPGSGCNSAKQALTSGNYGGMFSDPANPMAEWRRSGTSNYLTWTSKETKLILSVEAAKYIVKGALGEFGVAAKGTVSEETTRSVKQGEPGYWDRTEKTKYAPGGGASLYGEVGGGRWKAGAKAGVDYVPGEQGGWFIPVEAYGEVGGGTDATSQTVRLQIKASPEVTGSALNLEGGVLWNALFFQKGDSAVGYVFGVKGVRMSVDANGTTYVDLVIEGQLGPTFQKIFREQGLVLWVGAAAIVQEEMPQGRGAEGPLPNATKVGAGVQAGIKGEKAEGFVQVQLNPIPVTPTNDFTGRSETGAFQGMMVTVGVKF